MKAVRRAAAMACIAWPVAGAQQTRITVDALRTPSAPAFAVLGVSPSSVERPETPRAIATTVLSIAGDDHFPRNFALEIAPYWLASHPAYEFADSYHTSAHGAATTIATTLKRSFALSFATTPSVAGPIHRGTSIAMGARVMFWPGTPSHTLNALRMRAPERLAQCAALRQVDIDHCRKAFTDSLRDNLEPVGFTLQAAAGASAGFPNDTFDLGRLRRTAAWLSPAYRLPHEFQLIGVLRYQHDRLDAGELANASVFDAGGRIRWKPVPLIALSGELVKRQANGGNRRAHSTRRYGGVIEYRASDEWFLFYSLGKDFAGANAPRSGLLSIFGLNIGFGPKPGVDVN